MVRKTSWWGGETYKYLEWFPIKENDERSTITQSVSQKINRKNGWGSKNEVQR